MTYHRAHTVFPIVGLTEVPMGDKGAHTVQGCDCVRTQIRAPQAQHASRTNVRIRGQIAPRDHLTADQVRIVQPADASRLFGPLGAALGAAPQAAEPTLSGADTP